MTYTDYFIYATKLHVLGFIISFIITEGKIIYEYIKNK